MNGQEAAEDPADGRKLDRLQEPGSDTLTKRDKWIGIVQERHDLRWVVQSVSGRERVHGNYIEHADDPEGPDHGQRDAASRVAGFFPQGGCGVESDEGEET